MNHRFVAATVLAFSASLLAGYTTASAFSPTAVPQDGGDAPVTLADIQKRIDSAMSEIDKGSAGADPAKLEALTQDAAARALKGVDLAKLDAAGFNAAAQLFEMAGPERKKEYDAALDARAKQPTAEGFAAAVQQRFASVGRGAVGAEVLGNLLDHPGFKDGFKGTTARSLLMMIDNSDVAAMKSLAPKIAALKPYFGADASSETFAGALTWVRVMNDVASRDEAQAARKAVLEACKARMAKADERGKKSLTRIMGLLDGASMRGELIGFKAPDMELGWIARADGSAPGWKQLSDLKGKVVVLDFWATWCGPCVGSFPKVAEMRKAYPADKVEIVGVTSLQGYVAHQKRARVDCKGDAKKEQAETLEFMKDMGVTWTVAISGKDVFNPDFAISGIPFVAIIDQEGKVHKVGMHPSNDAEIRKTIDDLLAKKKG